MPHTREELEELFHCLDVNGDGMLDIGELEQVLKGEPFNYGDDEAHKISLVSCSFPNLFKYGNLKISLRKYI